MEKKKEAVTGFQSGVYWVPEWKQGGNQGLGFEVAG